VRNFLAGLVLGWLGAYWYYTQGDYVRSLVSDVWQHASEPPPVARDAH
jgi:hypothetical protein